MASAVPSGSTGRPCPEGLTWWRAGCGKTARPVREGRGLGNRPLTFIVFAAVISIAWLLFLAREDIPDLLKEVAVASFANFLAAGGGELVQRPPLTLVQPRRRGDAHHDVLVAARRPADLRQALARQAEDVTRLGSLGQV